MYVNQVNKKDCMCEYACVGACVHVYIYYGFIVENCCALCIAGIVCKDMQTVVVRKYI